MSEQYVIECRTPEGAFDFSGEQPEHYFGRRAITGIDEDAMAKAIFRTKPDAVMDGRHVGLWPALIDPRWSARRKTW